MTDKLYFVVLVLNATGLFSFLAPPLHISVGVVSLGLLALNLVYLAVKLPVVVDLFRLRMLWAWVFMLLIWPLATAVYAPEVSIREIGLQVYFLSLFFGAAVFVMTRGLRSMGRVLAVSLLITLIGIPLSMMKPAYFETVAQLIDARSEEQGRPLGFFMQPNILAGSMAFLFVGWFALWHKKRVLLVMGALAIFPFVMLVTGSRTGVLMAVSLVALALFPLRKRVFTNARVLFGMLLFVLLLGGAGFGVRQYLSTFVDASSRKGASLTQRMEAMLDLKFSTAGRLADDRSLRERFDAQGAFLALVGESPVIGYGLGSSGYFLAQGVLFRSAHSAALTCALEYGSLYPFLFLLLGAGMYLRRNRHEVQRFLGTNAVAQFVFAMLTLYVVNGGLLENRTFYVVWGVFFAMMYRPRRIFAFDGATDRIVGPASRG